MEQKQYDTFVAAITFEIVRLTNEYNEIADSMSGMARDRMGQIKGLQQAWEIAQDIHFGRTK